MGKKIAAFFGILFVLLFAGFWLPPDSGGNIFAKDTGYGIQQEIEKMIRSAHHSRFVCKGEMICGISIIPIFYSQREYRPAWVSKAGALPHVFDLVGAIRKADQEGLNPRDYHLEAINGFISNDARLKHSDQPNHDPKTLAEMDLILTDAFLMYSSHLLAGRVNPETIHTSWIAYRRNADLLNVIKETLRKKNIEASLKALTPIHEGYSRLRNTLFLYKKLSQKEGWPTHMPNGPLIRKGNNDVRVRLLCERLRITGDIESDGCIMDSAEYYDDRLVGAVKRFQTRHGLDPDGVVGPETIKALNVPVKQRLRQIEINLERWRWLPRDLGGNYLFLNIADFRLNVIENKENVLQMRVVVGRPYRRTPSFQGKITYLVINPYWNVPHSIAVNEILPKAKKDPNYLSEENIQVVKGWGDGSTVIDPDGIDWVRLNRQNFKFRFRQTPGPQNALGHIKFMFPNKFNVYLHDTPARQFFKNTKRDFSHGCVRLEKPEELAIYLLRKDPAWSREKLQEAIMTAERQAVKLPEAVPVHLLYWTAWVDEDGVVHFLKDIYKRDKPLSDALKEHWPREKRGAMALASP